MEGGQEWKQGYHQETNGVSQGRLRVGEVRGPAEEVKRSCLKKNVLLRHHGQDFAAAGIWGL